MIRQPEREDPITAKIPAYSAACWELVRINNGTWSAEATTTGIAELSHSGLIKRIGSQFQITDRGEAYLKHVQETCLADMWVDGSYVEGLAAVIQPLFTDGTLPPNYPWLEELKFMKLLELSETNQWGLSTKGAEWFFCVFGPKPLVSILKLAHPLAFWNSRSGEILVPRETIINLANTIPYASWAAILCSLPLDVSGMDAFVQQLRYAIKAKRTSAPLAQT